MTTAAGDMVKRLLGPALLASALLACGVLAAGPLAAAQDGRGLELSPPLVLHDGTVIDSGALPATTALITRGTSALQGAGGQRRHGRLFRQDGDKVCSLGAVDRAQTPSSNCAACHETAGHPVDVSYATRSALAPLHFRALAQVPGSIALGPQGEITCTSCHDGQSQLPHKATFESSRTLCLACHAGPTTPQEAQAFKAAGPRASPPATQVSVEAPGENLLKDALTEK
jgi:predicted CXXCH cytochrome family protein